MTIAIAYPKHFEDDAKVANTTVDKVVEKNLVEAFSKLLLLAAFDSENESIRELSEPKTDSSIKDFNVAMRWEHAKQSIKSKMIDCIMVDVSFNFERKLCIPLIMIHHNTNSDSYFYSLITKVHRCICNLEKDPELYKYLAFSQTVEAFTFCCEVIKSAIMADNVHSTNVSTYKTVL